ncbi:Uncharacterized protein dnm_045340 [Desulfonema magnum]|uniref:Uncharacterized protein n=1 Tax=Desulfonema magnum TaxID=45655 RepID=A0A975BNG4_9BACT|nr:Uncharacterized protein dnm_045340 [Desulfonema magnum]
MIENSASFICQFTLCCKAVLHIQQIEKFSGCRGADMADGGETRLFSVRENARPGKKPGFFAARTGEKPHMHQAKITTYCFY